MGEWEYVEEIVCGSIVGSLIYVMVSTKQAIIYVVDVLMLLVV